jgi:hypothetical protein
VAGLNFLLQPRKGLAIVPPSVLTRKDEPEPIEAATSLAWQVRILLLILVGAVGTVFYIALSLDPYRDGVTWTQATHTQLPFMRPCTFYEVTGLPCPSCGMTTSFALLVRGDVPAALRANSVGMLLCGFCMLFIPWAVGSAVFKRPLFVRQVEWTVLRLLMALVWLMLIRWFVVLLLAWRNGAF